MESATGPVVVGVDGSRPSAGALRWAAREAATRGLSLRVLHAAGSADNRLWATARAMVAEAVGDARGLWPQLTVEGEVVDGAPSSKLLEASQSASLVAVASRGIGGFPELLVGSVASQLALHADSPVVIVHNATRWSDSEPSKVANLPIVVGVNNSPDSEQALGAAFAAADAHKAPLVAVRTWRPQMVAHRGELHRAAADESGITSSKHYAVSEAVAKWRSQYPDVTVEIKVAMDSAAATLVGISREAQLLVLGSVGHSGGAGARLGATTHQVLTHAQCPIMIVRS
jgi:nucleotide-binding universal stress UspA family protein